MANKREKLILQLCGFDAAHYRRTERYARQIDELCKAAADEYAQLADTLFAPDPSKPFSFDDYPNTKQKAGKIASGLASSMKAVIVRGTTEEWEAACSKSDAFIKAILQTSRLTKEEAEQYLSRNREGLAAFQQRKVNGLGLSQRVWKYTEDVRSTIELGIDVGLGEGRSAAQLSRDLRECLVEPNKLFRRVRDKYGNLQLSKAASLYHPGQGVYRSSAANAMRLARTEVNMAYRLSDYLRWQALDFVVGIRISLSNNHTCKDRNGKPQPFTDMCDDLYGDYPKTFIFTGWHPQCRCTVTPILSDYDEYNKERAGRLKAIVKGEQYKAMPSRRKVTALPENFTRYVEGIRERAKGWKAQPYYIRDNFKGGTIEGGLKAGVAETMKGASTGKEAVKNNSKPCTEFDGIIARLKRWAYAFGLDVSKLDALRMAGDRNALKKELDQLDELGEQRQEAWHEAINQLFNVEKQASAKNFKDIAEKYAKVINTYGCETGNYYADCIKALKEAKIQAEAELAKALAEEAKTEYSQLMEDDFKRTGDYLDGEDYVFSKEFFDMLEKKPTLLRPHTNKGSYESRAGEKVVLDSDDRSKRSSWEKKAVVYHEYGHAIADQRRLISDDRVRELRERQIARLREQEKTTEETHVYDYQQKKYITTQRETRRMKAKLLTIRIDAFLARIRIFGDDVFTRRGITKHDVIEQIVSVQDTLRSLINSPDVGWGHSNRYFKGVYYRRHEYLAHAFENTFLGNRVFQHFMPVEYQEMIDLINTIKSSL